MQPAYLDTIRHKDFDNKLKRIFKELESCCICPRKCGVNRIKGEKGFCKTGFLPKVYSYMAHHGEEPPISGNKGSGAIFFSYCNLGCIYCQNYEFSQIGQGREVDFNELASYMIELQSMGCHNINLVTPTHIMPQILKSLKIAALSGLNIPIIYNTSGYELESIIKMLSGIIDIYLTDLRYATKTAAKEYSNASDYPENSQKAVKEMYRQVGMPVINKDGVIERGFIIRHLVLPNNLKETKRIMHFIANDLSKDTYISLMSQYVPYYKAQQKESINRRISLEEYRRAKNIMDEYGIHNGWVQESYGLERFAGVHIKQALRER